MPRAPLVRDDQLVQSIARRIRQVDQAGICAIEQHPLSRPLDQVVQELERAERDTQVRRENLARAPGRGGEIPPDRKRAWQGKWGSVRVELGVSSNMKKKKEMG